MRQELKEYVDALGLDAYLVGGAVRDELLGHDSKDADFLVPGVDTDGLKRALEPHGRVEDLVVAGRLVGVRLHPRDKKVRSLARSGIEFAPPRAERSTGPGRHDFEIVADPSLSVEDDMRRRDFTVNAMARRLRTGELVDPVGGEADLARRSPAHGVAAELPGGPAAARPGAPVRLAARLRAGRGDAAADARGGGRGEARLRRADRRRAQGGRDGRAVEAPARARARARAPAGARHRRPRRAAARVPQGDRLRPGEPVPRPDRRRAHLRRRAGRRGRGTVARRAARRALPRSRQADRRVARHRRPARTTTRRPGTRTATTSR